MDNKEEKRDLEIVREMGSLGATLEDLGNNIDALVVRVAPIVRERGPEVKTDEDRKTVASAPNTEMGRKIREVRESVGVMRNQVREIINRLEL